MEEYSIDIGELLSREAEERIKKYVAPDLESLIETNPTSFLDTERDLNSIPQTNMQAPLGKLVRSSDGTVADIVVLRLRNILAVVNWNEPATANGCVRLDDRGGTAPVAELRAPSEEEINTLSFRPEDGLI